MGAFSQHELETLLPLACAWAQDQQKIILRTGVALSSTQLLDARQVGVIDPWRVRLLAVPEIAIGADPGLASAASRLGLITPNTSGLTLDHGVFLRSDRWNDRRLLVHELAHVVQYERFGSLEAFLREYLQQCNDVGYTNAPLELEALRIEAELCV